MPIYVMIGKKVKLRKQKKKWNKWLMTKGNKVFECIEDCIYSSNKIKLKSYPKTNSKRSYTPQFYCKRSQSSCATKTISKPKRNLLMAMSLLVSTPMYQAANANFKVTKPPVDTLGDDDPNLIYSCPAIDEHAFETDNEEWVASPARHTMNSYHSCQFDTDSYPIGIDSLASACMSPYAANFLPETLVPFNNNKQVKPYGKGTGLNISHKGTICWRIEDDRGREHTFHIPNSLLIPEGSMRLLSPQHWAAAYNMKSQHSNRDTFSSQQLWNRNVLRWGTRQQYMRTIYNSSRSNVPLMYSAHGNREFITYQATIHQQFNPTDYTCFQAQQETQPVSSASETNRTPSNSPSDNPTVYIESINDFNLSKQCQCTPVKQEEEQEIITATNDAAELMRWHFRLEHMSFPKLQKLAKAGALPRKLANVKPPKCSSCIYGKMNRKPWRSKRQPKAIHEANAPGQCISVDQMESSTLGFVGQMKGKLTTRRYKYATVFIDHFSRYTYVHLQSQITSEETLAAKKAFEAHCRQHQVRVEHYHADNGRFADNLFIQATVANGQTISYCGVNAHWQNGVAERMIRTLREAARTQLLHSVERWPGVSSTHLWPYAIKYSAYIHNQTPRSNGRIPVTDLSGVEVGANLQDLHAFGCPVYALENNLAARKSIGDWNKRARLGLYLGPSPRHVRNVSLVLNIHNGLVSPQFHVKHDEFFETVNKDGDKMTSPWKVLAGFHRIRSYEQGSNNIDTRSPHTEEIDSGDSNQENEEIQQEPQQLQEDSNNEPATDQMEHDEATAGEEIGTSVSRRSGRIRRRTQALQDGIDQGLGIVSFKGVTESTDHYYEVLHEDDYKLQDEMCDPIAFKATGDPDNMYYHQALKAPDKDEFLKAIIKEVNDHIDGNHWELVPASEVPKGTKILDSVWAMKRKRDIKTRQVYKHKARLNIHGGQQEFGIHYTDTYCPVVNWYTVRLLLILSKIHHWHTKQIDFILAYPQADIPFDNYMKLPKGITTAEGSRDSHVLKLKKNIYDGRNSGRVWYDYLTEGLENIGFQKSSIDECLYCRKDVIFFFYVDDRIFLSPSNDNIDKAVKDLMNQYKAKRKFNVDDQGDITDYLGINFDLMDDGKYKLWQPHLIDQIIEDVGVKANELNRPTPAASTKILRRCQDAPSVKPPFNYRRVIGKLNFLEKSSRPDIAYAVHQCARFCSDPKEEHVNAVVHLVKYLKGTRDKGIILNPSKNKSFEVWVDADFAGNWNKETAMHDASTAKSRSGYVLTYGDCPIFWISKLQTQIALSSCEAEYVSLSQSLRDAIPVMRLLQELKDREFQSEYLRPKVHCKLFEDNTGALTLATAPKMRPRTKHINLVYHHFREEVRKGTIDIVYIQTEEQKADIFTKPLAQNLFQKFRKQIMGW